MQESTFWTKLGFRTGLFVPPRIGIGFDDGFD